MRNSSRQWAVGSGQRRRVAHGEHGSADNSLPTTPLSQDRPPEIHVSGLIKHYALGSADIHALGPLNLTVPSGAFVSIVGPSGCGKSTLLRIIAGLEEPQEGRVEVGQTPMQRRLGASGYMPQRDMLMPWRTVVDNATLSLEYAGMPRRTARQEASKLLVRFGLRGFERARPGALSGGMRQRVALARTLLAGQRALLLDEPFGALDALTRLEMQEWLLEVWSDLKTTVLFVTHDLEEAIYLSDDVYVMSARPGRLVEKVRVSLPRPRSADIIATPEFAALKGTLLSAIRGGARQPQGAHV